MLLQPEGVGLVGAVRMGLRVRRHGLGLGEPDPGIELARQFGLEIMRQQLGLGPVDDADGALEQRLGQLVADVSAFDPARSRGRRPGCRRRASGPRRNRRAPGARA